MANHEVVNNEPESSREELDDVLATTGSENVDIMVQNLSSDAYQFIYLMTYLGSLADRDKLSELNPDGIPKDVQEAILDHPSTKEGVKNWLKTTGDDKLDMAIQYTSSDGQELLINYLNYLADDKKNRLPELSPDGIPQKTKAAILKHPKIKEEVRGWLNETL